VLKSRVLRDIRFTGSKEAFSLQIKFQMLHTPASCQRAVVFDVVKFVHLHPANERLSQHLRVIDDRTNHLEVMYYINAYSKYLVSDIK
jgi:hypothetical protein